MKIENPNIELQSNSWCRDGSVFVRGNAYVNETYLNCSELTDYFSDIRSRSEFADTLEKINGFYSVVIDRDDTILAATDHMSTYNLYYSLFDGFFLTDSAKLIKDVSNSEYSGIGQAELLSSWFVNKRDTIYKQIKCLYPGDLICYSKSENTLENIQYYKPTLGEQEFKRDGQRILSEIKDIYNRSFKRLISHADGRQIVVPYSGHHDSTLVLLMLKKLGYENVITYTRKPDRLGSKLAKERANQIGYEWFGVEFTPQFFRSLYKNGNIDEYFHQAGFIDGYRFPHPFAELHKIQDKQLISEDCIICPGHAASGFGMRMPSTFTEKDQISTSKFMDHLYSSGGAADKCEIRGHKLNRRIQNRIQETLDIGEQYMSAETAIEAWEEYIWKTRQSSHILSDVKAYDYFNYECWFPLLDKELLDFWVTVHPNNKINRKFQTDYIDGLYKNVTGSSPRKGSLKPGRSSPNIRTSVKNMLKKKIKQTYLEQPIKYGYYLLKPPKTINTDTLSSDSYPEFGIWDEDKLDNWNFSNSHHEYRRHLMLHMMDIFNIDDEELNVDTLADDINIKFEKKPRQPPRLIIYSI